jgi:uncharacterized protein
MTRLLVIAKEPVAGRVKTRLCPPCTPVQAALIAEAALADTVETCNAAVGLSRRVLVKTGVLATPPGWMSLHQRGESLGERVANAHRDVRGKGPTLLVGMDTPQLTTADLATMRRLLDEHDAAIGLAEDGGWWCLALRDPRHANALCSVPTSTPETGALTAQALGQQRLSVAMGPTLRDVDTAADALAVADLCEAGSRFAGAVSAHLAQPIGAGS